MSKKEPRKREFAGDTDVSKRDGCRVQRVYCMCSAQCTECVQEKQRKITINYVQLSSVDLRKRVASKKGAEMLRVEM